MPKYAVAHADNDENAEPFEVVGSKDLRESFKDGRRLRGGFSLNGTAFDQFESNSIENLVSQINTKSGSTGVTATYDDGFHLVLMNSGPEEIRISQGQAYQEPPPAAGSTADEVVAKLKADQAARDGEAPKNTILEDLGLEANEEAASPTGGPALAPGMSAEDRKKAREEGRQPGSPYAVSTDGLTAGQAAGIPTNPSAPVTGTATGKMADGNDRHGQGAGYSSHPDGTRAVPGTPAGDAGGVGAAADNAPKQSNPNPV